MPTRLLMVPLCSLIAILLVAAPTARADEPPQEAPPPDETVSIVGNVTVGGQARILSGDRWSKFELYRDVPRGFFLRDFLLEVEKPAVPWFFSLNGQEAAEDDRRFRFQAERYGWFRSELRWTEIPRFSSRLTRSLDVFADDRYRVADPIQLLLETTPTVSLPAVLPGLLAATPFEDIRSRRRRFEYLQTITPRRDWRVELALMTEARTGFRPLGLGTYERVGTPFGSTFRILGNELAEPLDYRTTEFRAGLAYERPRGYLRFDYLFSHFENHLDNLVWDNPFRLNDAQANPPAGGSGRWRFGTGLLDLWPDNDTHTITFSGAYEFPHRTRLSGLVSLSWWKQDDPFLAYTTNTAVVTGVPAGVIPTDPASLPAPSLDGHILIHNQDWAVTSRLTDTVRLVGRYRVYDYNNRTEPILFPGYVAFGDAFWRPAISGIGGVLIPIESHAFDYSRQESSLEASWRPRKELTLTNEFAWEAWNRRDRQQIRTNEWLWRTQLLLQPVKWLYAKANYRYGVRLPHRDYDKGEKEFPRLRLFDQIHQVSHHPDALLTFTPVDRFSLSASYSYRSQSFDERFFGLITQLWYSATLDASYAVNDNVSFFAAYTRDRYRATAKALAKTGAFDFNPLNTFARDTNDRLNSLDLGFDVAARDGRLNWNVTYGFALSRVFISTFNPFAIDVQSTFDATAFRWPAITEHFQDFRTVVSYDLRPNLTLGARYLLEPRLLNDFTTDRLQPYMFGALGPEIDSTRWLFLDARDATYHGHAAAVFLRYSF